LDLVVLRNRHSTFVYFLPIETKMVTKMATNTGTTSGTTTGKAKGQQRGAMFNAAKCTVSKETQDLLNRKYFSGEKC